MIEAKANRNNKRLKLIRVVTDGRVLPWHLEKTITNHCELFDVVVIGEGVSKFSPADASIKCIDLPITPKINFKKDFLGLIMLIHIFMTEKPAIVHSIMPKAGLLTALAAFLLVPVRIHTFTGQVWQTKTGAERYFLKFLDKIIVTLNTACFTDSKSQSIFLLENGIPDKQGSPLQCILEGSLGGVDLQKINIENKSEWRREIRSTHSIPANNLVIGYLARKTEDKGAFLFLEMCKKISLNHSDVSFLFVGPDDSEGAIDNYLETTRSPIDNLVNVGQVSNHERYLAAFDILCLPSFREGFGSIVIDAASMEVPTVGSNIPGLVDAIVDSETGILFEAGNLAQLVSSVDRLLKDRLSIVTLGRNSRARVLTSFDSKILANALLTQYEDLYSQRTGNSIKGK